MKYVSYHGVLVVMLVLSSCDGFLTENPASLTTQAGLSSEATAEGLVNASYTDVNVLVSGAGEWGGNTLEMLQYPTGTVDGQAQAMDHIYNNLNHTPETNYLFEWWSGLYNGIKNANLAISKLQSGYPNLSESRRVNLLAETRTMRAFYYFYLVRIFGDVPKVTNVVGSLDDMRKTRSPVKGIYDDIIIPDLENAEQSALPWRAVGGRVSMGFVKSLLADVYLTYAGYPVLGGSEYYQKAADRAMDVIANGPYSLFDEYTGMLDPANENTKEFIYQIPFDKNNRNNPLTQLTLPNLRDVSPAYEVEFGSMVPRREFVAIFPEGDKRAEHGQYIRREVAGNELGGPYINKWYDEQAIMEDARSELDFTVYRLAEVMLIYAEAINRAEGGSSGTAIQYVNDIRERANLDPIGTMGMTEFEEEVWAQRYFELSFEGKIWFDMIRTRKVLDLTSGEWDDFIGHANVFGATLEQKHLLFPIPSREMVNNPNLTQNPGY